MRANIRSHDNAVERGVQLSLYAEVSRAAAPASQTLKKRAADALAQFDRPGTSNCPWSHG